MKRKEKREYKKNMNYGLAFDKKHGCKKIGTRDQLSMKNMGVKRI